MDETFPIADHLRLMTRAVRDEERDGRPGRTVVAERTFETAIEDLWDAITSAERIPRWFLPISGDLRLGGRYQLEGHAGGEITACDAPHHVAMTWEFGGDVSWVDVRLTEVDDGTHLVLEHAARVDPRVGGAGLRTRRRRHRLGDDAARPGPPRAVRRGDRPGGGHGLAELRRSQGLHAPQQRRLVRRRHRRGHRGGRRSGGRRPHDRGVHGGRLMHAFDVLGDPVRRRIIELLATGEHTSGAVVDVIRTEFGLSQPGVSQHLRVLRENGFANVRQAGTRRIYALEAQPLQEVDAWLDPLRRFWEQRLDALGTEIARGKRSRAAR